MTLLIAAGRGLHKVVLKLLERGADPNFLDSEDNDILSITMACNGDNPMTVRCLAERTRLECLMKSNPNPFEICISNVALKNLEVLYEFFPSENFLIETFTLGRKVIRTEV